MAEDETKNLNADSTNPLPFEEFVRSNLTLVLNQLNSLREKVDGQGSDITSLQTQVGGLQTQVDGLQSEIKDRFFELGRQVKDLDRKVDIFIKEQLYLKDEWRELRDSQKTRS